MNANETTGEEMALDLGTQGVFYCWLVPLVCTPGLVMASLCVAVFTRPAMRNTSLHILLCGLSLFDILVLATSLIIYPPLHMCTKNGHDVKSPWCQFFWRSTIYVYPFSLIAQTGSVWTCVAVTVDRFVAVSFPIKKRLWCTPANAAAALSVITGCSVVYKFPAFFELELTPDGRLIESDLRRSDLYSLLYITYGYIVFILIVPWSIIISLNAVVIRRVREAYGNRAAMTNGGGGPILRKRREDNEKRCTVMALVMTLTFVFCNMPTGLNNLAESFVLNKRYWHTRVSIGNFLVCLNSACNILIYSIFGKKFRQVCLRLLVPWRRKERCWNRPSIVSDTDESTLRRSSADPGNSFRLSYNRYHRERLLSTCGGTQGQTALIVSLR